MRKTFIARQRRILIESRIYLRYLILPLLMVALVGCGQKAVVGTIRLANQQTVSIRGKIPSTHWPSRNISFGPTTGRPDLHPEAIDDAYFTTTLKNVGSTEWDARSWTSPTETKLKPGQSLQLPRHQLSGFILTIIPTKDTTAEVEFLLHFEEPYTTNGRWELTSAWADGP